MARLLSQHAARRQRFDFFPGYSPSAENGGRFRAAILRWRGTCGGGSRETRRRSRLDDAVDFDKRAACGVVRMKRRFFHGQYRREAGIRSFEQLAPFIPRAGLEEFFE